MESRESTEPNQEDREQGTPQDELLDERRGSTEDVEPEMEGGADSAADAGGEGG